eukprot:GSMAST32.ASY1.ANO1.2355.1 assembled CDS
MLIRSLQSIVSRTRHVSAKRGFASASTTSTITPPTSTSHEKMKSDKRYKKVTVVPDSLTENAPQEAFSIKGQFLDGRPAYLDAQATTPLDPPEAAVEKARGQVADLIGCTSNEIVFTSGATECNNMAIKGVARFYSKRKKHIVTTQTEHKCTFSSFFFFFFFFFQQGFDITYLPVKENGLVDLGELEAAIRPGETEIGALCRKNKVFFHTDAAQMAGKMKIDVDELNIDLMSISGHKLYGPKGVGALYVRRRPRVRLRSGTLPHPLIAGLGEAAEISSQEMERDH